jgi:PAS domain S-box-containing protein
MRLKMSGQYDDNAIRAQETLGQNESQFKTLFMSLSDGFYLSEILYDDDGNPSDYRYLEVNPKFERIAGLKRERIVGKRYKELVPVDTTQWLDSYYAVARTDEPRMYEFFSDEYKMYFETYAYKTAPGQIAVIVRDVTERKRTEQALQNVQKLESLGTLAGGIAHDFNNMLCSVFGNIDLARELLSSRNFPEVGATLSNATKSLDMLRSLTSQLLTFSKGGAPCLRITALAPLIENSCVLALSGSSAQYRFDIASDLAACECDKNQITQVLTNIAINAKQAMPSGGEIIIAAKNTTLHPNQYVGLPDGGIVVEISITDHGVGIPHDKIKNIFDPFFTTKQNGHGLGLSTAFSIIKRHHGTIEVESIPGSGSTFRVFLPVAAGAALPISEEKPETYEGNGPVLVMDDDPFIRNIYRMMLELMGHTVIEAISGDKAIRLFKEAISDNRPFVVTILDLTIKEGKGGNETLSEIRKIQPDALVVVASGYADDPILANPMGNGFDDSLSKPFLREDLIKVFVRLFKSKKTQPSS